MTGQTLLTIVLVVAVLIWLAELVWLFRLAEQRRDDPFRVVSGAAIFFVAAMPVAQSNPALVNRLGDFWGRITGGGGGAPAVAQSLPRLLIDGEMTVLDHPHTRIGRYPNNEIALKQSTVSGYHAEIVRRMDGRYQVEDRGSRNGTRVNGKLIRTQVLEDGDLITLGAVSMHFLSDPATNPRSGMRSNSAPREPLIDVDDYDYDEQ